MMRVGWGTKGARRATGVPHPKALRKEYTMSVRDKDELSGSRTPNFHVNSGDPVSGAEL